MQKQTEIVLVYRDPLDIINRTAKVFFLVQGAALFFFNFKTKKLI